MEQCELVEGNKWDMGSTQGVKSVWQGQGEVEEVLDRPSQLGGNHGARVNIADNISEIKTNQ